MAQGIIMFGMGKKLECATEMAMLRYQYPLNYNKGVCMSVNLGDRVRDKITKLTGIAIAETKWLYGCTRITIQPEEIKDGKPAENYCVDEPQLLIIKKNVVKKPKNETPISNHGGRNDTIAISRNL
jgi:hypothetical protein